MTWRETRPATRGERWAEAALLAVAAISTILPRLATLRLVYTRGELLQWDGDSAYHLKRILHAMAHFPALIRFDPAMAWPDGAPCPWPDGFDYLAAAWGLVAGLGDPDRGVAAVLLFTPILAMLSVWAAMDLARLLVPDGPAKPAATAAAGLLTSVAPTSLFFSSVGFLDHHIAELLLALLLAGWALRRFPGPRAAWANAALRWELGGALVVTVALWVFAGGVLYVALCAALVGVAVLLDDRPPLVGSGALALALAAAASALLALPNVAAHGRTLSYQLPSLLQPLLVAVAAAGLALAIIVARRWRRVPVRLALVGAGALAVLAVGLLAAGAAGEVRAGLAGWLLRRDPWIATIAEFQPLGGRSDARKSFLLDLFQTFGAIGVAAPAILIAGAVVTVRTARARGLAFVALTVAFVLLTLNQNRFGRVGIPLLMIHLAAVLAAFAHRRARDSDPGWPVRVFPALAALTIFFADPVLRPFGKAIADFPPMMDVVLDLRDQARGAKDAGALTQWDLGHIVGVTTGLPTVTNGFGAYLGAEGFAEAEAISAKGPAELEEYCERKKVRYILSGGMSLSMRTAQKQHAPFVRAIDAKGAILDLVYMKAFGNAPMVIGGSGIPGSDVRHLEHLMPIAASRAEVPALEFPLPAFWVYERVAGARLTGTAPPGSRVIGSLDFREQGRAHTWRAWVDAGADGRFALVVPFPSGFARGSVSSASRWALRVGEGPKVLVDVPERAVRSGDVIEVGRIRAAPAAALPTQRAKPATDSAG